MSNGKRNVIFWPKFARKQILRTNCWINLAYHSIVVDNSKWHWSAYLVVAERLIINKI